MSTACMAISGQTLRVCESPVTSYVGTNAGGAFLCPAHAQAIDEGAVRHSIYAAGYGDLIKIGHSGDPHARIRSLRVALPAPVELLAYGPGRRDAERAAHQLLAECRAHGEWFHLAAPVLEFVASLPIRLTEAVPA